MEKEHIYNLEELHRGKWQPLIADNGKQKFAKITDSQAEIMNAQSSYSKIKYVKSGNNTTSKKESQDDSKLEELRLEYEKVVGSKPHHKLGEDKLIAAIEEKKSK